MSKQRAGVSPVSNTGSLDLTEDSIRQRAYELYEERGFEHGHDMDDWLQAEAEVMSKKPIIDGDANTKAHKVAAA